MIETNLRQLARELRRKYKWQNIGSYQIERILLRRKGNSEDTVKECASREKKAKNYLKKSNKKFQNNFILNLTSDWILLDTFLDGTESPLAQKLAEIFPILEAFIQPEPGDLYRSGDYARSLPGLPGVDWELYDKAVDRAIGQKLAGLTRKTNTFGLNRSSFNYLLNEYQKVKKCFGPQFLNQIILYLDFAKGGDRTTRGNWIKKWGIDPNVHNQAAAKILEKEGWLKDETSLQLIRHHGLIGQYLRGEITVLAFQNFTDWVKKKKINPETISSAFFLINVIDTAAVRDNLYTEELHAKFVETRNLIADVIKNNLSWEHIYNLEGEQIGRRLQLALRLGKLRENRDLEVIKGLIDSLEPSIFEEFYNLLKASEFWYAERATSQFLVENQAKLLFQSAKLAPVVNFVKLMHTLESNGAIDKVKIKVIDNYLSTLSWETTLKPSIVTQGVTAEIGKMAGQQSVDIDFTFNEEAKSACGTINEILKSKLSSAGDVNKMKQAMRLLEQIYGISQGALDRGLEEDEYMRQMEAALDDKKRQVLQALEPLRGNASLKIADVGAGAGGLTEAIAQALPQAEVYGLDLSDAMVAAIKDRSLKLTHGKIIPLKANVLEINNFFSPESLDAIITSSIVHEFCSFLNNYEMGETIKTIFGSFARLLRPGGLYIIRDFMQPPNPEEKIIMKIGKALTKEEIDPAYFLKNFLHDFKGFKEPIADKMTQAEALEIAAHYSWAPHYTDEVKERYAYKPLKEYTDFVVNAIADAGEKCEVVTSYTYLQPEYPEHILGRLDFYNLKGRQIPLPLLTGVIVIKKL